MRIIDGLILDLRQKNYQIARIGTSDIYIFYRTEEKSIDIKMLFYAPSGYELSQEDYIQLVDSLRKKYQLDGYEHIDILSLIFTRAPERSRKYCIDKECHWIIDLNTRRLLIFDNQMENHTDTQDLMENLLANDNFSTDMYIEGIKSRAQVQRQGTSTKMAWFTVVNTTIVVLNIIIHLLVHYTGLLGDTEDLLKYGALSWKHVFEKKEYYRLITSLFLHSDVSHLFNNMIILLFVGDKLERAVGKRKYLLIYLGTGLIAAFSSISYNMLINRNMLSIGASGAIFGVMGAVAYLLVANRGRMNHIGPQQIFMFVIFSLYGGIVSVNIDNAAHIGGLVSGVILGMILQRIDRKHRIKRNES